MTKKTFKVNEDEYDLLEELKEINRFNTCSQILKLKNNTFILLTVERYRENQVLIEKQSRDIKYLRSLIKSVKDTLLLEEYR